MRSKTLFALALLAGVATTGCSRRPAPVTAAPPVTPPLSAPTDDAAAREAAERARLAAEAARREEVARIRAVLATPVYFDFDESVIRDDSRRELDAKLPILRADPTIRLRIAGHTDERGSTEYNVALGMRRAQAVQEYLQNLGVDASRLAVTSFGEEQPRDPSSTEQAWALNRRAEFELTAGPSAQ